MELTTLKGIGEKTKNALNKQGIFCVEDLANVTPTRFRKLGEVGSFDLAKEACLVDARITSDPKVQYLKNMSIITVFAIDLSNGKEFKLKWFNQPYIKNAVKKDKVYRFWGKPYQKELIVVLFKSQEKAEELSKFYPIYRKYGISRALLRDKINEAQQLCGIHSILSEDIEKENEINSYEYAVKNIHNPTDEQTLNICAERIELENAIRYMINYRQNEQIKPKIRPVLDNCDINDVIVQLPYNLTNSQQQAVELIQKKLKQNVSINTIIQGDVGSGKTVVAFLSAIMFIQNGYQVAIMAPTEILAKQHKQTWDSLFSYLNIRCEFLSSSIEGSKKCAIEKDILAGKTQLVIGTHVLANTTFKKLGLVVIDEQHRFGVNQRAKLIDKSMTHDTLLLSATPIPRSVNLMIHGILDTIQLTTRPHQNNIETLIVPESKYDDMLSFVQKRDDKVFVVCPRIDENDDPFEENSMASTTATKKEFQARFVGEKILEINGKQEQELADEVLKTFAQSKTRFLVATTIVEVGMDIKEANTIIIKSPERFGLATLHQLRGRVGRTGQKAYCMLVTKDDLSNEAKDRLAYFKKTNDGFAIADYDFKTRGAGDIMGTIQHGHTSVGFSFKTLQLADMLIKKYKMYSNNKILID